MQLISHIQPVSVCAFWNTLSMCAVVSRLDINEKSFCIMAEGIQVI